MDVNSHEGFEGFYYLNRVIITRMSRRTDGLLRNRRMEGKGWNSATRPVFSLAGWALWVHLRQWAEMESDFKSARQSRYYYTPFPSIASRKRDINRPYVRDIRGVTGGTQLSPYLRRNAVCVPATCAYLPRKLDRQFKLPEQSVWRVSQIFFYIYRHLSLSLSLSYLNWIATNWYVFLINQVIVCR